MDPLLLKARTEMQRQETNLTCPHLLQDPEEPMICAMHPVAGLHCLDCFNQHLERSAHAAPCWLCGQGSAVHVQFGRMEIRSDDPMRIRTTRLSGWLWNSALFITPGLCDPCWKAGVSGMADPD